MRLRELVRAPAVTCNPWTTVGEAVDRLHLHDVGCLIVIDELGAVVGVVTDRDIALRGYGQVLGPSAAVRQVMTPTVATISLDADSDDAARQMMAHGVRRLPVLDAAGRLCGIVALDDLVIFVEKEGDMLRRALSAQLQHDSAGWAGTWDGF